MKKALASYFRKRYIDIPPVNMWRVCIIIPCAFGMFWLLGILLLALARWNISLIPEMWFIFCIVMMGLSFKLGQVISDFLQIRFEKIYGAPVGKADGGELSDGEKTHMDAQALQTDKGTSNIS